MRFIDLYNLAEDILSRRKAAGKDVLIVPVVELKDALIANIAWLDAINFHPIETKKGDPLGHFECHSDTDSRWDEPNAWVVLITYDRDLSFCKQRFVWCKELMHIFDTDEGSTKTPEEYRGLLEEIEIKPIEPSEQYLSENQAKWLALLILCPKTHRDELKARAAAEGLSDYDVALSLRVPERVISSLFSDYYDTYYNRFAC
jgi:hypothetical protein